MKTGRSKCRNQAIADMFQYMHIVEAWGTGIPRVITSCKQYGLQEPVFEEFGDGIKATVYRLQANSRTSEQSNKRTSEQADNQANKQIRNQTSETQDKIKEYLETVNDASSAEIAEVIGLSQSRTRAILSEMVDEVETIGSTSNRRYRKKK